MRRDISRAADLIRQNRRAIALTGAGISVDSGIPDFRSPGGLWTKYEPMEYATIEAFRRDPEAFDAVITDQTMPGMTGVELARQILRIRPDIPVILCSGFTDTAMEKKACEAGIRDFLTKPVPSCTFATTIRKVMEQLPAASDVR